MLERSGLSTLRARREDMSLKLAQKCLNNPRFSGWFVEKERLIPHVALTPLKDTTGSPSLGRMDTDADHSMVSKKTAEQEVTARSTLPVQGSHFFGAL